MKVGYKHPAARFKLPRRGHFFAARLRKSVESYFKRECVRENQRELRKPYRRRISASDCHPVCTNGVTTSACERPSLSTLTAPNSANCATYSRLLRSDMSSSAATTSVTRIPRWPQCERYSRYN